MNKRNKIAVIGAGSTGTTTALFIAQQELGDIVLVDIPEVENSTQGKALDMLESTPILNIDSKITSTTNYEDIRNANLVIVTAGIARRPGMDRKDLIKTNAQIMEDIAKKIKLFAPQSFILVLTNPVDAMTYTILKTTKFPKQRVIGQSGVLDTGRFCTFVAEELDVSVKDVTGFVLGGHGDDMVPLIRYSYVGGVPIELLISKQRIQEIIQRTKTGGGEIVKLLGSGSAYYAPAASITKMAKVLLKKERRILPAIAYLDGEYGYSNICLGVPTILSSKGIEKVIELELLEEEKKQLNKSAFSVKETINSLSLN